MQHIVPTIKVTIDGEDYSPADCAWLLYAGCGCVCGVRTAGGEPGEPYVLDSDEAFNRMYGNKEVAKHQRKLGFKIQLEPRSSVSKLAFNCPHEPKFGIPPIPTPDQHEWRCSLRGRRKHLYPVVDDSEWGVDAICGGAYPRRRFGDSDLLECARCTRIAQEMIS